MFLGRLVKSIFQELKSNPQTKVRLVLLLYRLSQLRRQNILYSFIFFPIHILYWIYSQLLLSIELPIDTKCGVPLIIWHGAGIVINPKVRIGRYVVIRSGVVIGNNGKSEEAPTIEDFVEIGANAVLVGNITIGKGAKISPNSFVNYSVPAGARVISVSEKKWH